MPCLRSSEVKITLSNSVFQRKKKCAFVVETNLSETFFFFFLKICQMIMLFNPFLMQSEEPVNVGAVTNDKWIVPLQINQSLILQ